MSTVNLNCYLIVKAKLSGNGQYTVGKPSVRLTVGKPNTDANEVAVKLNLELPISLFQKPQLSACIKVPAEVAPFEITTDVQESIVNAIREQSGFDVHISVGA